MSNKPSLLIQRDEHDENLLAKRVNMVSSATIYAVTNTVISLATADFEIGAVEIKDGSSNTRATVGASGLHVDVQNTVNSSATILNADAIGLATVDIRNFDSIGLATVNINNVVNSIATVANADAIGLATVTLVNTPTVFAVVNTAAAGQASVVLDTGANWVGLATVQVSNADAIGLATVDVRNTVTVDATSSGDVPVTLDGETVTLGASSAYIGLATVNIGTAPTLTVDATGQGDVPVTLDGEAVVIGAGAAYVGLATVDIGSAPELTALATVTQTTGVTLEHLAFAGNTSGAATIFIPTGTFKITNIILSANATVGINFKSGPTYLTGNASISMTLFPGGGLVENGDLLNPVYNGLADAGGFVIETDSTTEIAGKVTYYEA